MLSVNAPVVSKAGASAANDQTFAATWESLIQKKNRRAAV